MQCVHATARTTPRSIHFHSLAQEVLRGVHTLAEPPSGKSILQARAVVSQWMAGDILLILIKTYLMTVYYIYIDIDIN